MNAEATPTKGGFGIKCNVKVPHKFLRMGALCWVLQNKGDRLYVRGISRNGGTCETWINARPYLHNFRAGFHVKHYLCLTRERAQAIASQLNEETWTSTGDHT